MKEGFHSIPTGAGLLYPPPPQGAMLQEVPFLMIDLASHLIVVFRALTKRKTTPYFLGPIICPDPQVATFCGGHSRCMFFTEKPASGPIAL